MTGVLGSLIAGLGKGKPAAPTGVTATDVGTGRAYNNGAATVSFTAGAGPTATSYTVTSSPGGYTASGASSPLTVTGLQSSTSYTFTVTATNAVGTSDASSASASITATTVPQAPTIGSATGGNASATVTYTAGATGGKTVSTYTATSSPGSLTGTGASPITVSGLTNGTAYTFTVTATNANGTSAASSASNSVTPVLSTGYYAIAHAVLSGDSTVTFSSIPQTYTDLQIVASLTNSGSHSTTAIYYRFNADSASNYYYTRVGGGATSTGTVTTSSDNALYVGAGTTQTGTNTVGANILDIYSYANTSRYKALTTNTGMVIGNTASQIAAQSAGQWRSTSAINTITFAATPNTMTGSITIYGIKAFA